jgi:hypothetical protein
VLLAFTIKGIFTTGVMVMALLAAMLDEGNDVLLHVLVWLAVGIGGYAVLGGTHGAGAGEDPTS